MIDIIKRLAIFVPAFLSAGLPDLSLNSNQAMAGQSALLLGSTGQVGRHVLKELLASPHFTRVAEYGRRVTPLENLADGKDKLEQKTIDFENLAASGLGNGNWDVVFISLGTSKKNAGSAAAFEKIDREYVLNAAKEAKSKDPNHPQRLVYVSSIGANPNSSFLYPKSKGMTEEGLAALGYNDTIIYRPALLKGTQRPEFRLAETIGGFATGLLAYVSDGMEINVATLAKSLVKAGRLGSDGLPPVAQAQTVGKEGAKYTLIENAGALGLAKYED